MPKEPFHDYDPYDHLVTVNLKLDELIQQHNRLGEYCRHLEARIRRLETDNKLITHRLRQFESKM